MGWNSDHERFVAKNKMYAQASQIETRDKTVGQKGFSHLEREKEASCFNCKLKNKCPEFRAKRTGQASGVASYGGTDNMFCEKFDPEPAQKKGMSQGQIKSLLKNAKRGHI